tara:strand:+ start:69 stop:677 length:609 start_codon:yes stop_codon:yes gene_type:complete
MTKKASEKRKIFNREFREARAAFRMNPTEKNFTFTSKVDGGKKTVLRKGETKQGLMKKFRAELNSSAPTKTTDSIPGYLKRKATGKRIVKNTKLADVTKQELDAWKAKNKGLYKGKALTAYLNAKGRNISTSVNNNIVKTVLSPERKVIPTKKRIISNAAIRKFMREKFPGRLSKIEIGDTVFFTTNAAGDPVVFSVIKKAK